MGSPSGEPVIGVLRRLYRIDVDSRPSPAIGPHLAFHHSKDKKGPKLIWLGLPRRER